MGVWLQPSDVISRWIGPSCPQEASPVLATLINDAEDAALEAIPDLAVRIDSETLPLQRVKRILSSVVIRAYKIGGEQRASYSQTSGPFSESGTFAERTPRGVKLTAEEIAALSPSEAADDAYMLDLSPRYIPGFPDAYTVGWL